MDKPKLKATASPKTRQQFKLEKNTKFQADFRYNQSKVTLRDRNVGRSSNFILPVERYEKPCETSLRRNRKKKRERKKKNFYLHEGIIDRCSPHSTPSGFDIKCKQIEKGKIG